MKRLAVIGASTGQLQLVRKAKQMGLEVHCFAWDKNAVCKNICDSFHPMSIFDTEAIVLACKEIGINGVVSNASEETALASSQVAEALNLNCTPSEVIRKVQNKYEVRNLTDSIPGLSKPEVFDCSDITRIVYPCVVKPVKGSAKRGVTYCNSKEEIKGAVEYARQYNLDIIAEEFISGNEYSVETISFHGRHNVVQITRKVTTGFPHFVELEHHQPADLPTQVKLTINHVVSDILSKVGITNGASHIEIKVNGDKIFLIEINPRGGGDRISDILTGLSTDCDYLRCMIDVALDDFEFKPIKNISYSGILFLSKQNSKIKKYFDCPPSPWMIERYYDSCDLRESKSNYDRNGYLIYNSQTPLNL